MIYTKLTFAFAAVQWHSCKTFLGGSEQDEHIYFLMIYSGQGHQMEIMYDIIVDSIEFMIYW